jgi:CBS domain
VLTPRSAVVFLDIRDSVDVNREKMRQEPHEILPFCDGGLAHVVGVVHARRVLGEVLAGNSVDLKALAEPALFVPETMTILRVLEEFKRTNLSAALVVGEFGEVDGIVSVTDVVTSIVGGTCPENRRRLQPRAPSVRSCRYGRQSSRSRPGDPGDEREPRFALNTENTSATRCSIQSSSVTRPLYARLVRSALTDPREYRHGKNNPHRDRRERRH